MDDSEEGPSAAKKQKIEYRGSLRKWSGAATYRSKFQVWQQKWPFAVPVKGDPAFAVQSVQKLYPVDTKKKRMWLVMRSLFNTKGIPKL